MSKAKVFGAPLEQQQFLLDQGCMVPRILVSLKRRLEVLNGLETTGIFRVAGSDQECLAIVKEIEKGKEATSTLTTSNPHNYSTLMKRYFTLLPLRLLDSIPSEELVNHQETGFRSFDITKYVSPVRTSVYNWVVTVFLSTLRFTEENKMSVNNLAIVWAPVLFDTNVSSADLMKGIAYADAQRAFLEYSMEQQLILSEEERARALIDRVQRHTNDPKLMGMLRPVAERAEIEKNNATHTRRRSLGSSVNRKLYGGAASLPLAAPRP